MSERNPGTNVLVIDDESSILESLRILLRNEGFTPHVAHGGKQVEFPDFTRGRWQTTAPLPVYGV